MISRGSEWHRWEPHIHAPGTILNNQFGTTNSWSAYLTTLEALQPEIQAIAVTEYYVTDTYEEFLKHKAAGRLPGVKLLFPNIELRLDAAAKSGFVNIHLLVSPEDPAHLEEVKRILKRLQFGAHNDRFDCTREELIKLGKRVDPTITDDGAALRCGATQVKVNFDQLRKVIHESEWAGPAESRRDILAQRVGDHHDQGDGRAYGIDLSHPWGRLRHNHLRRPGQEIGYSPRKVRTTRERLGREAVYGEILSFNRTLVAGAP